MRDPRDIRICFRPDGTASIHLGDVDIADSVQALSLTADSHRNRLPMLTLDLVVLPTIVEGGLATIGLPERTEKALIALGWTPPVATGGES